MRFLQNAVFAALKRVQLFLDEYAAVLAAIVDLTAARKRLDAVVGSFSDHAYNQDANDRGVMTIRNVAASNLYRRTVS